MSNSAPMCAALENPASMPLTYTVKALSTPSKHSKIRR